MGIFKILEVATTAIGLIGNVVDIVQGIRGKRKLTKEELIEATKLYEEAIELNDIEE